MANAWRGKKQKPFKIDDFMLNFKPSKARTPQTPEQIRRELAKLKFR